MDVIKIKKEKSSDLIKKQSLMCKLLALQADDKGTDPENLVRDIYSTAAKLKQSLTNEQLLLIEQWVSAYKKIPAKKFEKIKKEVKMPAIATTIDEHFINIGIEQGMQKGIREGIREGIQKGKQEGIQEGKQEGIQEGKQEGIRSMINRLLSKRFGKVPGWVDAVLDSADIEKLELWAEKILDANSLEEVFS